MQSITTIGLDIAKSVFQVHGVDAEGHVVYPPSAQASLFWRSFGRRRHAWLVSRRGCTDQSYTREESSCQPGAVHTRGP